MGLRKYYSRSRNSANQITFELARSLPKLRLLWNAERLQFVRRLIKRNPNATLRELCEELRLQQGLSVSISSMSRAIRKIA